MGVKIFLNDSTARNKASVTQIASRLPRAAVGKKTREQDILDLMDAAMQVPFLMGSGAVVARGVVGPGFDIVEAELGISGSMRKKNKIRDFFNYVSPTQSNIKDTFGPLAKIYTTAFSFRLFGHAAWEIVTDKGTGRPLGFDWIPGVVRPNVEPDGTFKRPAYTQFIRSGNTETKFDIDDPDKIIFFSVPDYAGGIYLAELLALSEYTLPSEIYAALAYRSLHENRDAPYSGFWYTPADIDDDTWERFVSMVQARYTGASNYGRNPIIMKGEGGFKSITPPKEDAPYVGGRELNRKEIQATSGVPGAKYGVDSDTDLQEMRREFYESTLRPSTALMEEVIYTNVCIRLFDAPEWKVRFRRPDFTTAVEDASIELRRIQWGQWSPNEARASRGEPPRGNGDYYLIPKNMDAVMPDGKPGAPDNDPVDDSDGDMSPSDEDRVPDTQPPEVVESRTIKEELKKWKRFALRIVAGKRFEREFVSDVLPKELIEFVSIELQEIGNDATGVSVLFDELIEAIEDDG